MSAKTIYVRDEDLWNRARALAGQAGLSGVIAALLGEWVERQEAVRARDRDQLSEIELWVGGKDHRDAGGDGRDHYVAFTGRQVSTSTDKSLEQTPRIDVYLTKKHNLIVYRDWRHSNEDLGATYSRYPDFAALGQDWSAFRALWQDSSTEDAAERPDLEQEMLHEVADALGEKVVIRID